MMQINESYYEDLDEQNTNKIVKSLLEDKPLKSGSYKNRKSTAPENLNNLNGGKIA